MAFDYDEFTKKLNKKYPYWKDNLTRRWDEPTFLYKVSIVILGCFTLGFVLYIWWIIGVVLWSLIEFGWSWITQ